MDAEKIQLLLEKLGSSRVKANSTRAFVHATCPLARWEHSGGRDEHPSFGVSIVPNGVSYYRCFACGARGDLVQLLFRMSRHGMKVDHLQSLVSQGNKISLDDLQKTLRSASYFGGKSAAPDVAPPTGSPLTLVSDFPPEDFKFDVNVIPESVLSYFDPLPQVVQEHLRTDRRLYDQTIKKWELCWHEDRERIAIPVRDMHERLVNITGRAYNDVKPKYLHTTGFRRDLVLYGENFLPKDGVDVGYLVEGFFDAIYLTQVGLPAVAVMGSNLSQMQAEKVCHFMRSVVVVPDGDAGGKILGDSASRVLSARLPVRVVTLPQGKDPDELTDEEIRALLT